MKKTLLQIVFSSIIVLGMVTACKKSNDNSKPAVITRETLAGTYKITAFRISVGGSPEQDYPFSDCQKDDQYQLKLDSSALYIDAGVKCNPPGDQTGTWQLSGNKITISAGTSIQGDIQSFDGKTLVVTGQGTQGGITYTFKATLTKL